MLFTLVKGPRPMEEAAHCVVWYHLLEPARKKGDAYNLLWSLLRQQHHKSRSNKKTHKRGTCILHQQISKNLGEKSKKKNPYHPSFTNKQVTNKHTKRRPEGTCQHRVGHPMQDGEHNPPAYLALRFCNQISEIIHLPTSPGLWPKGIKRLNSIKSKRDF